ncbi:acetyltransferase family protein [Burkholderia gladioli]|uniref:Acetyltransferase family protein n=2 Tax=Burkholderia gladioli TaxID=28095 RepID=A0AAW3EUS5_BURGA|nr:acetyltransferase family protein [Burkholderia gladioli]KGC10439.1 acetyltransferase family protein [Burkholderia gladioli]SPV11112.1 N-acetyltransferase GCN5 [Burkholderia gladioli]
MLELVPMSDHEFAEFEADTVASYAAALVAAGDADSAAEFAASHFARLLPLGRATPGHQFFRLHDAAREMAVGRLWLGETSSARGRRAFLYDLLIEPGQRGQGLGAAALQAAEDWARARGLAHLDLNVFEHNVAARRLYDRSGYRQLGKCLSKALGGDDPA